MSFVLLNQKVLISPLFFYGSKGLLYYCIKNTVLNKINIFFIMQLAKRINIPIFRIVLNGMRMFLLKNILIDSTIKYKVVKKIAYITIGLKIIEDIKSKFKSEIIALVPPQAGQYTPR